MHKQTHNKHYKRSADFIFVSIWKLQWLIQTQWSRRMKQREIERDRESERAGDGTNQREYCEYRRHPRRIYILFDLLGISAVVPHTFVIHFYFCSAEGAVTCMKHDTWNQIGVWISLHCACEVWCAHTHTHPATDKKVHKVNAQRAFFISFLFSCFHFLLFTVSQRNPQPGEKRRVGNDWENGVVSSLTIVKHRECWMQHTHTTGIEWTNTAAATPEWMKQTNSDGEWCVADAEWMGWILVFPNEKSFCLCDMKTKQKKRINKKVENLTKRDEFLLSVHSAHIFSYNLRTSILATARIP